MTEKQIQDFDIDVPQGLIFIDKVKGGNLYTYGIFGVIIDNTINPDDITSDKIIDTFKEIRSKLIQKHRANELIAGIHFKSVGDTITYTWSSEIAANFERIRRITGYLVGTTDRFNNAKRAEESERKKHTFDPS